MLELVCIYLFGSTSTVLPALENFFILFLSCLTKKFDDMPRSETLK